MDASLASLKQQLVQLKSQHAEGSLSEEAYQAARANLEQHIVQAVMAGASQGGGAPAAAVPDGAVPAQVAAGAPSKALWLALGAFVVAIAGAGYAWKSSADKTSSAPAANMGAMAPAGEPGQAAPHDTSNDQILAMTERLAQKLKDKPQDVEGWAMLARSYNVLGNYDKAASAYEKAMALRKDDAALIADYADALAMKNNQSLLGEPLKQVERALKIDPNNIKALSLAGTAAFDRKDYAGAVKYWDQVVKLGPAENDFVKQVQTGLVQARSLAGMPAVAAPAVASTAPDVAPKAAAAGATVSGTVTLAGALAAQVSPQDTVFVFARAPQGGRAPLAVLRRQVKDLPLKFTLDDSMAMSPQNALSSATQVVVSARVSKSGNAMPQSGDFTGQAVPAALGATGLSIEIREQVK